MSDRLALQEVPVAAASRLDRAPDPPLLLALSAVVAAVGGVLTGGFAAWAYHDDFSRPVAHSFGLWILAVASFSLRRSPVQAALNSTVALWAAVAALEFGGGIVYGSEYPAMPYEVDSTRLVLWLVLATVAGPVLGLAFHRAGYLSTAAAVGLVIGDAYRRWSSYPDDGALLALALLAVPVLLSATYRDPRQLVRTVAWTVPMAVGGAVLVSLPDVLEQVLLTGGLG
jgi:hypothetical protein